MPTNYAELPEEVIRNIFFMLETFDAVEQMNATWKHVALEIRDDWLRTMHERHLPARSAPQTGCRSCG
jgi:hypothetical protein